MGVVLKAHDPSLNRIVAVKLLAPALAADPLARRRFLREARAAAAVCHEHVVNIHAVAETDHSPYLVMQFIAGQSLQEKLDRAGPLGVTEVLRIGMQVAAGLAAAHAQGIVHRDIKPSNILLENSVERVKITDFGLARSIGEVTLSDAGTVSGTPGYMSPEQASGGCVDQRSDLFSLGSLLYAMCTGRAPFRGDSPLAVLRQVSDLAPRPIRAENPDVPEWLAAIVARLMAKDPADRYPSASAVAELLASRLAEIQLPASAPLTEPAGAENAVPRTSRRRSSRGLALLVGGLLVIATLAWLATRPAPVMRRADPPAPAATAPRVLAPGPSSRIKAETKAPPAPSAAPSPEPAKARSPGVDPAITELTGAIAERPDDKHLFHRRGLAYRKAKDYTRAIADFDEAIAIDRDFCEAYHDRGWTYVELGNRTRATDDFSQAIRLRPNDAWLIYCRGLNFNELSDWARAIPDLKRAHELNPKHDGAPANLGKAYRVKGDLDRSLDYCRQAVAIDPANPWNYVERGLTYRERKEWELALQDFRDVQRLLRPEHPKLLVIHAPIYLGDTYAAKGEWGQAVPYYDEAIRLDDANPHRYAARGQAYVHLEKWDSAIADFDMAIALEPGSASLYAARAAARRQKGQPALAIEDFNQAIGLKPNDFSSIYQRGELYLHLGDGAKALADFEASVKLNPGDAWARMARAQARRITGDLAGSIEDCDEAIRLVPGVWFYHLQRGFAYQAREDWRQAIADFDRAIELGAEAAEVYDARAAVRAKLGDAAGAADDTEHARRLRAPGQSTPASAAPRVLVPGPSSSIKAETKVSPAPPSPEPARARSPDVDPAIIDLTRAIAEHPDDKQLYHQRGMAFKNAKEYTRAIADFDRAIALDPDFYEAYFDRAWAYIALGNRTRAIDDVSQAIRVRPDEYWANLLRGQLYNELGNWDRAIPDLQRAHELNLKHGGALACLGKAYRGVGDLDRALDYCQQAVAIDPADPSNYVERGLTYRDRKEWELALQDFHHVQRLVRPDHPKVLAIHAPIYLADTYVGKGEWGQAVPYYDEAIRLDGANPLWHAARGRAYAHLEKWDSAIADFDKAIALQPGNASLYAARASARRQKGEPALAIADFTQAIRLKPNDFGSIYQRGEMYLRLGDGKKALADFDASVKLNPGDAWARMARGEARRDTGDLAGSIEDCDEAIRLKPGFAFFHLQRGYTYQAREDWRRAVADFDKAIELGLETAAVYNARAAVRAKLNDAAGAAEDTEHARRLRAPGQATPNP
jgi:tetratricopeptide (TPR) repeat protein